MDITMGVKVCYWLSRLFVVVGDKANDRSACCCEPATYFDDSSNDGRLLYGPIVVTTIMAVM